MGRKKVSLGGDISKSVKGTFSLDKFKAAKLNVKVAKAVRGDWDVFIDSKWVNEFSNTGTFLMTVNDNVNTFQIITFCRESGLETALFAGAPSTIVVYSGLPMLRGAKYHEKFNEFQNALLRAGIVTVSDSALQHHIFLDSKNLHRFCTRRGTSLLTLHKDVTDDVKHQILIIIKNSELHYKQHGDNYIALSRKPFKTAQEKKLDYLSIQLIQIEKEKLQTLQKHTTEDQLFRVVSMYTGVRYYVIRGWQRMDEDTREFILRDENIDCFFNNFDKHGNTRLCSCGKYADSDEEDLSEDEQSYYSDEEAQDCHCGQNSAQYTLLPTLQTFTSERECTDSIQKQRLHPSQVAIYMKQIGSTVEYIVIKNWDDLTAIMKTTVHENLLCFLENKDVCRGNSCKHKDILQNSSLTYRLVVNSGRIVGDLQPLKVLKTSDIIEENEVKRVVEDLIQRVEAHDNN